MRAGVLVEDPVPGAPGQPYLDLEPDSSLDELSAAAVRYRIVVGPLAGRRTMTLHDPAMAVPSAPSKPFTVSRDGFSLNIERTRLVEAQPTVALAENAVDHRTVIVEVCRVVHDGQTPLVEQENASKKS